MNSIDSSVDFRATSGSVQLKADQGAPHGLDLEGVTVRAPSGNNAQSVQLVAENVQANDTTIVAGQIEIKASKQNGGTNNLVDAQLRSDNGVTINGETVDATDARIVERSGNGVSIKANKGDNAQARVENATVLAEKGGSITVNGNGVVAENAVLEAGNSLTVNANNNQNGVPAGTLRANGSRLTAAGGNDLQLVGRNLIEIADSQTQEARIDARGGGSARASVKSRPKTIRFDGVVIIDQDDVLKLNESPTKEGDTESGSVD